MKPVGLILSVENNHSGVGSLAPAGRVELKAVAQIHGVGKGVEWR